MITTEVSKDGEYFKMVVKVAAGPGERFDEKQIEEQPWWLTIEGIGVSRNSGRACAYALEDLAAKILKEEAASR